MPARTRPSLDATFRNREKKKRSWEFDVVEQGWRYHMSDIMASIGIEQLKKFDKLYSALVSSKNSEPLSL